MKPATKLDEIVLDADVLEALDMAAAQRKAAIDALREVLALVDRRSYLTEPQQAALWNAEAIIAEYGK